MLCVVCVDIVHPRSPPTLRSGVAGRVPVLSARERPHRGRYDLPRVDQREPEGVVQCVRAGLGDGIAVELAVFGARGVACDVLVRGR